MISKTFKLTGSGARRPNPLAAGLVAILTVGVTVAFASPDSAAEQADSKSFPATGGDQPATPARSGSNDRDRLEDSASDPADDSDLLLIPAETPVTYPAMPATDIGRQLTGNVVLSGTLDVELIAEAVVSYRPDIDYQPAPAQHDFQVVTEGKRFKPDVLAIPVGSTVHFPNNDVILHNAFSVSASNRFDLGLYRKGESRSHRFDKPGLVKVHCNVHHPMQADILVMDSPWYAMVDANGNFRLAGLPDSTGKLIVWHPRSRGVVIDIAAETSDTGTITLSVDRPRVPRHKNKHGRSYRPSRRGY